ncbi:hypothetical protein GIB67_034732 [Kingdonia uniflora]|uniref:Uncharacterized protein n=1 Tax=Kingdonia uniflora TaxID=39325 RepID=A0A7J7MLC3_9MAGN|nr:hypothetical protein GIB67_034732 [Kingdonia uniflora]
MDNNKNRTDLIAAGRKKLQQFRQKKGVKGKSSHKTSKFEQEGDTEVLSAAVDLVAEGEISSPVNAELPDTNPLVTPESGPTGDAELLSPVSPGKEEGSAVILEDGVDSSTLVAVRNAEEQSSKNTTGMVEAEEVQANDTVTLDNSVTVEFSPIQERKNQEAACSGSNQFDGVVEENRGSLQNEGPKNGFAADEIERDGHNGSSENILDTSYVRGDVEVATSIPEVNVVDYISVIDDTNQKLEGTHNVTGSSVSVALDSDVGYQDRILEEVTEVATCRADETNKISSDIETTHDVVDVVTDQTHESDETLTVDRGEDAEETALRIEENASDETHEPEEALNTKYEDDTEETIHGTEGTNVGEGTYEVGSFFVAAGETNNAEATSMNHEVDAEAEGTSNIILEVETEETTCTTEGTHVASDISVSAEAMHEGENTSDTNQEDKLENGRNNSSYEASAEIITSPSDIGSQADMEYDRAIDEVCRQQCPSGAVSPLEANREVLLEQTISLGASMRSIDLYQHAVAALSRLDEEQLGFLLKSIPSFSKLQPRDMDKRSTPENEFTDVFESLKQQVYIANVLKDFLQLQLLEQIDLQMDYDRRDHQLQNEVSNYHSLLEETQSGNTSITKELEQCRFDLLNMAAKKEELQAKFLNASVENTKLTIRASELQTKLEMSHEELKNLSVDLADCHSLLEMFKTENSNLKRDLVLVTDAGKKFEEEKEYYALESVDISAQLLEHQNQLAVEQNRHGKLELDLKEAVLRLEQLTEENMFLSSTLEIHKAKMEDVKVEFLQLSQPVEAKSQQEVMDMASIVHDYPSDDESHRTPVRADGPTVSDLVESVDLVLTEAQSVQHFGSESLEDAVGFIASKAHLEEAEKTRQKLKKAIEGMQSHSVALSRSAGKKSSLGVSKLIQAFESKVHQEENTEEVLVTEGEQSLSDPYTLAKEQTRILGATLKELELNTEKVNEAFMKEQDSRKLDALALGELQVLYEASKKHTSILEVKNIELENKLFDYQSRLDYLVSESCQVQQNLNEKTFMLLNQAENLQKEMVDRILTLENDWNCNLGVISEAVVKLDASTGRLLTSDSSTRPFDSLKFDRHIITSVNAASKVIDYLHDKLEAACADHEAIQYSYDSLNEKFYDLHVRNELAVGILGMVYFDLKKFVSDLCQDVKNSDMGVKDDILFDHIKPCNFIILIENLSKLLEERLQLKSANKELESELLNKEQKIEKQNRSCIDSEAFCKLVEYVKTVVELDEIEDDSDKSSALRLESLIAVLVRRCREAMEQVNLSLEELGLTVIESSERQEEICKLSSLNIQSEDEIHILKENSRKLEEALETVRTELQAKGAELEQSEQRVSSVREKLSIAVTKGKGLVVQRDSLKQSLSEISAEIERRSQELQLKDMRLREVETKLKAYSESGERVEALESELSYIRNSATALRESFLFKDSILQRVEEILEDLELPEHFHSRDIIEKIEWLAKSVTGNSLPSTDWGLKSTGGEGSFSDTGFVVMDSWKDDGPRSSNPALDDLRSKYEDLQSKYYGLAEQNEMLEQSLMERNNLVQRWEAVLDRIDMPFQMRSMEPEDRIQWLGSALSESHHDRESLHEKIENFESYCGSLNTDLEVSQRNVSNIEAALVTMTHEKDLLFESVENLSNENVKVSEKAIQSELEKEKLQNEVNSLQEKLVGKEGEITRVQLLVSDALHSHGNADAVCSGSDLECLEVLLRRLIENYMDITFEKRAQLTSEKHVLEDTLKERDVEHSHLVSNEQGSEDALKFKEEELADALSNLTHMKEERDRIIDKHQSLVISYEELGRQKDDMQERLNQEEQKLASTREKLNVAVRKGKALVQQRDSLKQTISEMNNEVEHLKREINKQGNVLIQYEQKIQNLSTYPEKVESLGRENSFLRNRLAETEHNLQAAISSSEQELKKSKREMELLLAELNEVQERGDGLQEELTKVEVSLTGLAKENDLSETERLEALSRLEKFVSVCSEESYNVISEIRKFKAGIDGFSELLVNAFSADLDLLRKVESRMEMLFKQTYGTNLFDVPLFISNNSVNELRPYTDPLSEKKSQNHFDDDSVIELFGIVGYGLQECTQKLDTLKDKLYGHCLSSDEQAKKLSKVMEAVCIEIALQAEILKKSEIVEDSQKELKATISNLQKELQEKDIQRSRIYAELVNQIKEAEATATNYSADLEAARTQVGNLERRVESVEKERSVLELRINELEDEKVSSTELHDRVMSLTGSLTSKEQEIEALMQALDEEESQMEGLTSRIEDLEKVLHQKNLMLESLEASRTKTMAKLSTTVCKFDELHQLSESLLSESEILQSQLQDRDAEISFLRQEVTRCTNDALTSSQEIYKINPGVHDFMTWLDTMISRIGGHNVHIDDKECNLMQASKEILEKQITSIMSELEDTRVMAQNKDALLQAEKSRVEELLHKGKYLENSLREMEFQLSSFQGSRDLGGTNGIASPEIMEVEPMINKRLISGASISPHVRSMRKVNNDQVAISIDNNPAGSTVDDEDDNKVHGFKSLTTSRVVPRFTRPVSDMVDGLWVSCDRALMRQPALRLGIILYWVLMHALLVTSIV